MFTRRRYHLRAGFLLACSLTLGCQSVGPGAVVTPHAAVNPGRGFATAPTIVVRSTPPEGSAFRQVAYWRADGEPATQWRPVQRPAETAGAGGWWTTPHLGDAASGSMPTANGAPPAVLSEAVLTPAAGTVAAVGPAGRRGIARAPAVPAGTAGCPCAARPRPD